MVVPIWLWDTSAPKKEILVYAVLNTTSDTAIVTAQAAGSLNYRYWTEILLRMKVTCMCIYTEIIISNTTLFSAMQAILNQSLMTVAQS